jgi:DNA gyrase subunit A
MHDQGLNPGARFQKGAAIVGEVPKHYHPHGGVSVYHTMVRLAQPSNKRNPMASEQGTFGSQDGDSALAHRYTEARLAAPASELLADVEKETRQTQGVIIMLLDDEDTVGTIVGVGTGEEVEEEA